MHSPLTFRASLSPGTATRALDRAVNLLEVIQAPNRDVAIYASALPDGTPQVQLDVNLATGHSTDANFSRVRWVYRRLAGPAASQSLGDLILSDLSAKPRGYEDFEFTFNAQGEGFAARLFTGGYLADAYPAASADALAAARTAAARFAVASGLVFNEIHVALSGSEDLRAIGAYGCHPTAESLEQDAALLAEAGWDVQVFSLPAFRARTTADNLPLWLSSEPEPRRQGSFVVI